MSRSYRKNNWLFLIQSSPTFSLVSISAYCPLPYRPSQTVWCFFFFFSGSSIRFQVLQGRNFVCLIHCCVCETWPRPRLKISLCLNWREAEKAGDMSPSLESQQSSTDSYYGVNDCYLSKSKCLRVEGKGTKVYLGPYTTWQPIQRKDISGRGLSPKAAFGA